MPHISEMFKLHVFLLPLDSWVKSWLLNGMQTLCSHKILYPNEGHILLHRARILISFRFELGKSARSQRPQFSGFTPRWHHNFKGSDSRFRKNWCKFTDIDRAVLGHRNNLILKSLAFPFNMPFFWSVLLQANALCTVSGQSSLNV